MENFDYGKLDQIFKRYGGVVRVDVKQDTFDITGYGRNSMSVLMGKSTLTLEAEFYSGHAFSHFANDLLRVHQLDVEEAIRADNPTVQRAWEEYQLLLKLSK
jgi:hypothetical protein